MGLADYQPPVFTFPLQGGSLALMGLSLQDVSVLVHHHLPDLEALWDIIASENINTLDADSLRPVLGALVMQAPGFTANVIALGCGEPDHAEMVQTKLSAPVQIEALLKIGELTFVEVGGAKKAMETVAALLKANNLKLTKTGIQKAG
jgi:hypothetical protein